jgi:hypothetical protein
VAIRFATGSATLLKDQFIEATVGLSIFAVAVAVMLVLADYDQAIHHFVYKH